ncbi:hypothetical protein ACFVHB_37380 [Kitasatospora sp. NPDC127111]|uniref:hypothetical protein n=1 Tax=Kitasatospora sp. NPDC127111 TaxID=3345363 RepID=UPI0036316383
MKDSTIRLRVAAKSALLAAGVAALIGLGHTSASGAGLTNIDDDRWGITTPIQPIVHSDHFGLNKELHIKAADERLGGFKVTIAREDDDRWG